MSLIAPDKIKSSVGNFCKLCFCLTKHIINFITNNKYSTISSKKLISDLLNRATSTEHGH